MILSFFIIGLVFIGTGSYLAFVAPMYWQVTMQAFLTVEAIGLCMILAGLFFSMEGPRDDKYESK